MERTTYTYTDPFYNREWQANRSPMPPDEQIQKTNLAAMRPQMGEWRTIHGTGHKSRRTDDKDRSHVWWMINEIEPIPAMYIGYRTVKEGYIYSYGWNERMFHCERTLEVWMFVPHDRMNPIYVFPEDVADTAANQT